MEFANLKGIIAKAMMFTVAAGALAIASPIKAEAQRYAVGVRAGDPYYAPRHDDYDRYQYARHEAWARQQEFERREAFFRHQEWLRDHRFDRGYEYR